MSSSLACNERVDTVRDIIMTKNTYRLLAIMSDSNFLRLSWNLGTKKKKNNCYYIQPSLQTHTYTPGNSLAMSVDEASPSNNTPN